jgi:hypothetical protein
VSVDIDNDTYVSGGKFVKLKPMNDPAWKQFFAVLDGCGTAGRVVKNKFRGNLTPDLMGKIFRVVERTGLIFATLDWDEGETSWYVGGMTVLPPVRLWPKRIATSDLGVPVIAMDKVYTLLMSNDAIYNDKGMLCFYNQKGFFAYTNDAPDDSSSQPIDPDSEKYFFWKKRGIADTINEERRV